ncbi:hypothetical protein RD792_015136 [Penstemon davidsonii]|uniref:Major facilitator superfamily (MFS) profile domain-containing protein n=1 Tax=Penstemon davidsonii TaxID=160366 RepID=A0ABR0CR89_9LAMI|nr:hypothetical protein RD792_015136 [Penstemon davidsonii]
MHDRHSDTFSMYKRGSSKDHLNGYDREKNLGWLHNGVSKDIGNPSWKRPLPHILVATLSSFLYGYHLGVVNDTLESISLDLGFGGSTLGEGTLDFSGWISDGLGRRRAFQLCALPMIIGASMSATTSSLEGMLLGRLFVGTGMGLGPPVAALYVSEVSPAYVRGTFGSFTQIATCLGLMSSLLVGIPAKNVPGWWRVCFWVSAIPAGLLIFFTEFSAESPHWLFKRGRIAETEKEVEKLFGASHVKATMADFSKSDRGDGVDVVKLSELIHGRHSRVVFIGSILYALQQLSGINAVFFFSSTVFRSAGVPSDIGNMCVGIVNITGSIVAMILMDRLGRKAVAMGIQVIAANGLLQGSAKLFLSVGGMLLFVMTFSIGAGPVPGLLLSEIFPSRIRAKAMALCMAVHWVINFLIGLLFLRLLEILGAQILYTIFGIICLSAVLFVKKNVVETKGKSLQEIELAFLPAEK